jgi:phosphatidylglycerophosphatase A
MNFGPPPRWLAPQIATCAGLGSIGPAPGTWASLAMLPVGFVVTTLGGPVLLLALVLALFAVGVWAVDLYVRSTGREDPPEVVVDEVVGMGLVLVVTSPHWLPFLLAFMVFRTLDILKPWPIGIIDREIKGGFGAMLDDAVAGVIGAVVMLAVGQLL